MRYNEIQITADRELLETTEAALIGNGFTAMEIDDPEDIVDILENRDTYRYDYISDELTADLSRKPVIRLYFEDNDEGRARQKEARELLDSLSADYSETTSGDDSEWLYKWQEYFKPARIGERIVVKPSWEEYKPSPGELVIEMDPGMAFGSGLHETTSMCIRALEMTLKDFVCSGKKPRLLDVGCGTGILSIAGALLGAEEALGTDIDPDAVNVARENIRRNGLEDRITAEYGNLTEGIDYKPDIIVANLMADLVILLSPAAAEHLKSGGIYITSGILDIKENLVREAITGAGFEVLEVMHEDCWCAVIARKKGD